MSRAGYNPGQKVLGHLPFFTWFGMKFAANLRYTLIKSTVEVYKVYKIYKRCLTCNTKHCSGGREVNLNDMFLPKTQSVPNVLARIVLATKVSSYLKEK